MSEYLWQNRGGTVNFQVNKDRSDCLCLPQSEDGSHVSPLSVVDPVELAGLQKEQRMDAIEYNLAFTQNLLKDAMLRKIGSHHSHLRKPEFKKKEFNTARHSPSTLIISARNGARDFYNYYAQKQTKRTTEKQKLVKTTIKMLDRRREEIYQLRMQDMQRVNQMKEAAYEGWAKFKDYDYQTLKAQMRQQKQGLVSDRRPAGKIFGDDEDFERAAKLFKMQRENMMVSIEQKTSSAERLRKYQDTHLLRDIAEKQ